MAIKDLTEYPLRLHPTSKFFLSDMFGTIYKVYKIDNNDVHSNSMSLNFSRTQNPNLNDKRGLVENIALKIMILR